MNLHVVVLVTNFSCLIEYIMLILMSCLLGRLADDFCSVLTCFAVIDRMLTS